MAYKKTYEAELSEIEIVPNNYQVNDSIQPKHVLGNEPIQESNHTKME